MYVPNVALYQAKLRPDYTAEGPESLQEVGVASRKDVIHGRNVFCPTSKAGHRQFC